LRRRVDKVNQLVDVILKSTPKNIGSILDIGCGLGLVDLVLYKRTDPAPDLYLLDKDNERESLSPVRGGFHKRFTFTADLDLTRDIFAQNGARIEQVNFVEPDNSAIVSLPKMDLILSITSWGFHYPIETYWDGVRNIVHDGTTLFIDLRKRTNGFDFLKSKFSHNQIIDETETYFRVAFSGVV
jgi:SAM-dependent methyltransferase